MIELAVVCSLLGAVSGAASTAPYVVDTLRRSTVPHRGSWFIWSVLEVVAVESQRADGARWSLLPLGAQAAGTCLIFVLSLRLGSGGLSRVDLGLMALAAAGVAGWLAADEPLIATACVIAADLIGGLMMLPKAWHRPHSETASTFLMASVGGVMTAGSVGSMSLGLLAYPIYFMLVNGFLAGVIVHRRRSLKARTLTGADGLPAQREHRDVPRAQSAWPGRSPAHVGHIELDEPVVSFAERL
jgi:hypothetical protein